jgi:pimeloyl-ACP methyl ester carboxylesterase
MVFQTSHLYPWRRGAQPMQPQSRRCHCIAHMVCVCLCRYRVFAVDLRGHGSTTTAVDADLSAEVSSCCADML